MDDELKVVIICVTTLALTIVSIVGFTCTSNYYEHKFAIEQGYEQVQIEGSQTLRWVKNIDD